MIILVLVDLKFMQLKLVQVHLNLKILEQELERVQQKRQYFNYILQVIRVAMLTKGLQ